MAKCVTEGPGLPGRQCTVVAGRVGEPLAVRHAMRSRRTGGSSSTRPMFLCVLGWGSNERDMADLMRYVAPYNDFASLRAPLTLEEAGPQGGAYSWFHDCVPTGEDLDRDAFAAASAIDAWVTDNIPSGRDVVPLGFSQGGLLAVHLLRVHPERYRAAVSLSGFLAPGRVDGSAPADSRLAARAGGRTGGPRAAAWWRGAWPGGGWGRCAGVGCRRDAAGGGCPGPGSGGLAGWMGAPRPIPEGRRGRRRWSSDTA